MMIFNGPDHAKKLDKRIKTHLKSYNLQGALGIVQIGDDPGSNKYIDLKRKYCNLLNIKTKLLKLEQNLSDQQIKHEVKRFFSQVDVKGGIIQLPLPRDSLYEILDLIPEEKDIDLLNSKNYEKYYQGDFSKLSPVMRSFDYFITENKLKISGKKCILIGKGFLTGKPINKYLNHFNASTDIIQNYVTGEPLNCHLLVLGAGVPNLVMGEDLNEGCNLVDFGYSLLEGKSTGDFCLESKAEHLGVIAPSPGGLGPLVVRFLIMNFLGI